MSANEGFTPDPEVAEVIRKGDQTKRTEAAAVRKQTPATQKINIQDVLDNGVGDQFGPSFKENHIRNQFVRKVYSIIGVELLLITGIVAIFQATARHNILYGNNQHAWFIALIVMLVVFFVSSMVLGCGGERISRNYPTNMILLTFNMVLIGVILGIVCSLYNIISILIAAGFTLLLVAGITLFAFSTRIDFTKYWIFGITGSFVLSLVGTGVLIVYFSVDFSYRDYYMMRTVWGGVGALVMSFILVLDTQWIIIGKHKYSCSPEDHVLAAFVILHDIILIFLYILRIFGIGGASR